MPRVCAILTFGSVAAYGLLHVALGWAWHSPRMWGFDILHYCAWPHRVAFACLLAGSMSLAHPALMARAEAVVAWLGRKVSSAPIRLGPLKVHGALFVISLTALLLVGTKYSGGDARWMSGSLPLFLKRSPLSSAVLVAGTRLGECLGFSYLASLRVTITVVGALSVCGLYQLFVALFGETRRAWAFLAVALSSYGISRLLPGYIEVYGAFLLFLIAFEWALVRYCLTGQGLAWVFVALFVLVLAHVQAVVVIPGVVLVGAAASRRQGRLWRFAGMWLAFGVSLALVYPHLRHRGESYQVWSEVVTPLVRGNVASRFWSTHTGGHLIAPAGVLLSREHWLEVANTHALVSAVGVALVLSALPLWWRERKVDALLAASALNYLLYLVGSALFYNFLQPVVRDWDMFGPGALYLVVLAGALWRPQAHEHLRRTLLVVFSVAAFVTALWLAQQAGALGVGPPPKERVSFELPG